MWRSALRALPGANRADAERLRGHGGRFSGTLDTETAIAESYRFRIAVECASFRQPGYAIEAAQMAQLRRAHERILALHSGSVDGKDWFRVNSSFHEVLAAWSGNRFILQAVRRQSKLRQLNEYADFPTLGRTTGLIAEVPSPMACRWPWAQCWPRPTGKCTASSATAALPTCGPDWRPRAGILCRFRRAEIVDPVRKRTSAFSRGQIAHQSGRAAGSIG